MRKFDLKPGLSYLSALFVVAALFASPLTANAQTQRCELDWDCSGFVTFHDVYKHQSGGLAQVKSTGFYADVYYYTVYHNTYPEYVDGGYFHQYMQCGSPGNMDWNGDGVIDMTDAYEGNPSSLRLDNFYTQWYVWEYFHRSYDYFYPDSDCQADQPGSCEGKCGGFGGGANLYPCWCTEDCADRWDGCCDDYEEYCVEVNACDPPECDDDGICDEDDNCPCTPNPGQENTYGDERGDACEPIVCDPGYEPRGTECVDIDECARDLDNCVGCELCQNQPGSFACLQVDCEPGYHLVDCECVDMDECAMGVDNCDQTADCVNWEGSFECVCPPGSYGDGLTACHDEDECALGTHNCDPNAYCTNVLFSFTCTCKAGYTGDGVTCTDINECVEGTHHCDVLDYTCENTEGSYNCVCIDSDGDGMCNIEDPCPSDPFNNCCQSADDCALDEYCEIADETCGLEGQCVPLPLACDEMAAPVCGCDGHIYWSECEADWADAAVAVLDVCASTVPCAEKNDCAADEFCFEDGYCMAMPQYCPAVGTSWCGIDGGSYDNACLAAAAGTNIDPTVADCGICSHHSDCGPNEYCAGDGCGADLTCDPLLPEGICTPKRDIAECDPTVVSATCGCDYNFYLNECEMEAAGVRYQSSGLCPPISGCQSDADCPCGQSCVGSSGTQQCLPD